MALSAEALIHIVVATSYVLVCLLAYRQLVPRLSPTFRLLASVMLVVQIFLIIIAVEIRPISGFEQWFWNLDEEFNLPTTFASAQLALVSAVALVTAWLARTRPAWHRIYLGGIGLVFLYLASDEFFTVHEDIRNWQLYYAAVGAVVAAATAIVATGSPRRTRVWHLCLLTGLALSATGAIVIEQFQSPAVCDSLGLLPEVGRCQLYNIEESFEFLGIWLSLVAVLGMSSYVVTKPYPFIRGAFFFVPVLWIIVLSPPGLVPFVEYRLRAETALVQYRSNVELRGYLIDREEGAIAVQLYASTVKWNDYTGLGYSIHLVDQVTGESFAGTDEYAHRRQRWPVTYYDGKRYDLVMYRQRIVVDVPPQIATNRAFWVVLTLWRKEGDAFVRQHVISSDNQLLNDTQVVLDELVLPENPRIPRTVPLVLFDNGYALDAADIPSRARPGDTLPIAFAWRSDTRDHEDYVQFLHFFHQESGNWWTRDQQPLGPRLPTRLWYNGLSDTEVWQVPVPADLEPGQYSVYTGLYRVRDHERVPATDAEDQAWIDSRVPLGVLIIEMKINRRDPRDPALAGGTRL